MRMMTIAAVLAAAFGSACAKEPQEFNVVAVQTAPPRLPAECKSKDPAWIPLDRARQWKTSDILRRDDALLSRWQTVASRRAVCRAGVAAAEK